MGKTVAGKHANLSQIAAAGRQVELTETQFMVKVNQETRLFLKMQPGNLNRVCFKIITTLHQVSVGQSA
jgi:hypothetical protein